MKTDKPLLIKRHDLIAGIVAARVREGKQRKAVPTDFVVDVIRDAIEGKTEQPGPTGHASDGRPWQTYRDMIAAKRWSAIAEALGRTLETAGSKWERDNRRSMPSAVTPEQIAEAKGWNVDHVIVSLRANADADLIVEEDKKSKRIAVTMSKRQNAAAAGIPMSTRDAERKKLERRLAELDTEEEIDNAARERALKAIGEAVKS